MVVLFGRYYWAHFIEKVLIYHQMRVRDLYRRVVDNEMRGREPPLSHCLATFFERGISVLSMCDVDGSSLNNHAKGAGIDIRAAMKSELGLTLAWLSSRQEQEKIIVEHMEKGGISKI